MHFFHCTWTTAQVVSISVLIRHVVSAHARCDHEECFPIQGTSLLQTGFAVHGNTEHHHVLTVREYLENEEGRPRRQGFSRLAIFGGGMAFLLFAVVGVSFGLGLIGSKSQTAGAQETLEAKEAISTPPDSAGKNDKEETPSLWIVMFFVIGHAVSASSLTVVNKFAMEKFHPPLPSGHSQTDDYDAGGYVWTLVLIQFLFATIAVRAAGATGIIKVDPFHLQPALHYFPAAGMFMITIVAGNAVMNYTNVNTFLILRALVPVPCALLETLLYADPIPSMWSWLGLAITVCGAALYAVSIGGFEIRSLSWAAIFLTTMPIDGILIKHSISTSKLSSWGLVYYNNILASMPLVVYVYMFELTDWGKVHQMIGALSDPRAQCAVLISCIVGVGISFFQLNTRYYISATAFMILGVANKFLTVLWSEVFFGSNGFSALLGILLTLGGAVFWQLSVGSAGSVKLRTRSRSDTGSRKSALPFVLTLAALAWAAWIQHCQMASGSTV